MTIHRIEPGKRMSQAIVANGLVWLAGQYRRRRCERANAVNSRRH